MELRNLRHVVALGRTLNYVRAGEELGLSQSALTRSIQATERLSGLRLFDRDRGGVRLTRHGHAFVERAKALLAGADDMTSFLQRAAGAKEGDMPFGMEPLPARVLLPRILPTSIGAAPNLRHRVFIRSIEALWDLLKAEEIDFFVSPESRVPVNARIRATRLGTLPLSFLVRAGHPLLDSARGPGPFPILLAGEAGHFETFPQPLREMISGPRHIIEDYDILAKVTAGTDAILIASACALRDEIAQGLVRELPIDVAGMAGGIPIILYAMERKTLSPGAAVLKDLMQRQINMLVPRQDRPQPA